MNEVKSNESELSALSCGKPINDKTMIETPDTLDAIRETRLYREKLEYLAKNWDGYGWIDGEYFDSLEEYIRSGDDT